MSDQELDAAELADGHVGEEARVTLFQRLEERGFSRPVGANER